METIIRYNKRCGVFICMLITLALGACKENLSELNLNPNALTDDKVNPAFVLTGILAGTTGNLAELSFTGNVTQCVIPQAMQYTQRDYLEFVVTNQFGWYTISWDYRGLHQPLSNAHYLETRAQDSPDSLFLKGAALTMQAFWYGMQTSIWGDIPYSQAYQGSAYLQPVFDAQRDVFAGLLNDLEQANRYLMRATGPVSSTVRDADLLYGGEALLWRKFANSLRLRYLLRLSEKVTDMREAGIDVPVEFKKMVSDPATYPIIVTTAENASLSFPGTNAGDSYPLGPLNSPSDHEFYRIKAAATLVDFLEEQHDPRLTVWFRPVAVQTLVQDRGADAVIAKDSDGRVKRFLKTYRPGIDTSLFVGLKIALTDPNSYNGFDAGQLSEANGLDPSIYNGGAANPFVSYLAPMYRADANPLVKSILLSAAEVHFILAEAANRGWIQRDVLQDYLAGVFASLEQYGIADGSARVYDPKTHQLVDYDAVAFRAALAKGFQGAIDKGELILQQKWAALFTTMEGWFDWRRTGYPRLGTNLVNGPQGEKIPVRYMYGDSELNYNRANTEAAISHLEPATNEQWSKMWLIQGTGNPW